ncbi:hypothetical protein [Duganella sp. BuS-21]|uniref:hypothetical protein n=1 Tax=Duganella sp. BuS-21 TaxID=2943848 RepID=UPI0035A61C2C
MRTIVVALGLTFLIFIFSSAVFAVQQWREPREKSANKAVIAIAAIGRFFVRGALAFIAFAIVVFFATCALS